MRITHSPQKPFRWVFISLGTVLLSAIGSAVWEAALKPLSSTMRDICLNVITLGIGFYKNSIYQQVAKGSTNSLFQVFDSRSYFMLSLFGFIVVYLIFLKLEQRSKEITDASIHMDNTISEIENSENRKHPLTFKEKETIKNLIMESKQNNQNILNKDKLVLRMYTVFILIIVSFYFTSTLTSTYINSAVSNYYQLKYIATPYLTQQEIFIIDSEFGQISSKEDYLNVISKLEQPLARNKCRRPKFNTW